MMPNFAAWHVAATVLGLVGAGMLLRAWRNGFQGRPFRAAYRGLLGCALVFVGLFVLLMSANLRSYARLSYEKPVAEVSIQESDKDQERYDVTVLSLDGSAVRTACSLQGDEWLLSARVQKWKPWMNLLGFDSTYTLEQIGNKYLSSAEAEGKLITVCDINSGHPGVARYLPADWLHWITTHLQADDRRFGSANYMPLTDGAAYIVLMTQGGLNTEPLNDVARAANDARP